MNQSAGGRHRRSESVVTTGLPLPAAQPTKSGVSWWLRPRTVRAKIVALLAVPVIALMALWGLAAVTEVRAAYAQRQVAAVDKPVRGTLADAQTALALERTAAVRLLTQPGGPAPQADSFAAATSAVDDAVAAVRTGTADAAVPIDALGPELRARIRTTLAAFDTLPALRQRVTAHTIATADVYDAYTAAIDDARNVGDVLARAAAADRPSSGTQAAAILGLLAVLISLPVSVRVGRGLVIELVGLRDSALDLAGRRLPAAIARLRAGGSVDLEEAAPLPVGGTATGTGRTTGNSRTNAAGAAPPGAFDDEIGQVAEALAVVQRAALEAAVERAEMVSGVARIFLNLARRSQILVHRQLALLDAMERRVADPAEIEDLFRLDHLATRMRRHAESLIILSGQAPGRGWRRPVPLLDVLRSAVAEVEDFARVDVHRVPPAQVSGGAVADLTHLVAELVENATLFSPPDARVTVRAVRADRECVVEVEDTGLGMGPATLADANARLSDARQTDMFDSDRLGLFVVSRLARRHGVSVLLRTPEQGGTVAEVRLPVSVLEEPDLYGEPDDHQAPAEPQRAARPGAREPVLAAVGGARGTGGAAGAAGESRGNGKSMNGRPDDVRAERRRAPAPVGENGLPRRVRQTSLAPQLRGHRKPTGGAEGLDGFDGLNGHDGLDGLDDRQSPEPRSPEEVRATMAALQNGWTLGRVSADDDRDDRRGSG